MHTTPQFSEGVAAFASRGSRPANAALAAFVWLNGRLFDVSGGDPLGQLGSRTTGAHRALADGAATVTKERYLCGTIAMSAGDGCAGGRRG
ncbi:hypothetical protein [Halorubrum persicum]|uniref:hypothetical protein n=1 Tax=Halorubrum persicum TaxID=1383844 RepID=UPI0015D4936D|nr:hypothetical protein [Halorubrum persicum]